MYYIRASIEKYKYLRKALEDGKISKYEALDILKELRALLALKKANQKGLEKILEKVQNDAAEKERILTAMRKQQQEELELKELILTSKEAIDVVQERINNILPF